MVGPGQSAVPGGEGWVKFFTRLLHRDAELGDGHVGAAEIDRVWVGDVAAGGWFAFAPGRG